MQWRLRVLEGLRPLYASTRFVPLHTSEALAANVRQLTYAGDLLWLTVVYLVQVSILHYYLCRFQQQVIMWLTYVTMGLCSALWIATFFATVFFCTPPSKLWWANSQGHCGDRKMLHTASSVTEVILNGFILLLPLPIVWHMRLVRARKVALGMTYLLGIM